MTDLMKHFETRADHMIDLLTRFVEIESPSTDKAAVDQLGALIADHCRALGAEVTVAPRAACGDLHLAKWNTQAPGKPILMLAHIDTVWPLSTLATMPVRRDEDRLYGPGTVDMKGGSVVFLTAVAELQALGIFPDRPIWALFTTDEETGSEHSADYIQEVARQVGLVLVTEGASPSEQLKTARKATGVFTITAFGRAAHAGAAPEQGINAIVEIAHQVEALRALNDPAQGTTVNATIVSGGTRENVIPAQATLTVDTRASTIAESERITRAMQRLTPTLPGATLEVRGYFDRPPMERDTLMVQTFEQAAEIAAQIGHPPLEEESTGSGSDGNFTAALGIPVLDGLGPPGGGAHAAHEHVLVPGLARRAALMAGILLHWPAL